MSTSTYLGSRIDVRPLAGILAVGDTVALGAFVTTGSAHHGIDPLATPGLVAEALVPFLLAWLAVGVASGLYTAESVESPRTALVRTVPAWIVAVLLGHALRASPLFRGGTTVAFLAVTFVVGGVLVVGWRLLAGFVREREKPAG